MNDQDPVVDACGKRLLEPSGLITFPTTPAMHYPADVPNSYDDPIDKLVEARDWLRRLIRYHLAQAQDFHLRVTVDAEAFGTPRPITPDTVWRDSHLRYLYVEYEKHKARAHAVADALAAITSLYHPTVIEEENLVVLGQLFEAYTVWATTVPDEAPAFTRQVADIAPRVLGELVRSAQQTVDQLDDTGDPF